MTINFKMVSKEANKLSPDYDLMEKAIADDGVILHGIGQFGLHSLEYLLSSHYTISALIDTSPTKRDKEIDGYKIHGPDYYQKDNLRGGVLVSVKQGISEVLATLGGVSAPKMSFESFYMMQNIERYNKAHQDIFFDAKSKETLCALILAALSGNNVYYDAVCAGDQYFCLPQFNIAGGADKTFVDAGAYVGDTIERFIWAHTGSFKHIYAFEPIKKQYDALRRRVGRLSDEWAIDEDKITLVPAGLSSVSQEIITPNYGAMDSAFSLKVAESYSSGAVDNFDIVELYSIDGYFTDIPLSLIKADIEGMEMQLLEGARQTIMKNKPALALCTYHRANDLLDFIEFLSNLDLGYKFALRHHTATTLETVLYCWV